MTVPQFMLGFVLGVLGYPFSLTLTTSIFSKVVGDINPVILSDVLLNFIPMHDSKGFWLGLFATFGSLARVVGPMLVTEVYQELGTYAMTGLVIGVLVRLRFI